MKRAVELFCAGCGRPVTLSYQLGKGVKDRKPYCTKCYRKKKEELK